jgi:hypothetical protein
MTKDQQYEVEKAKLQLKDLTPEEYEKEIRKICKKLNY